MVTVKACWLCSMNSKPSPTCRVSLELQPSTAMHGRNFLETWMMSLSVSHWITGRLHAGMLHHLLQNTPLPSPDDQYLAWAGLAAEGQVGYHLLVELNPLWMTPSNTSMLP